MCAARECSITCIFDEDIGRAGGGLCRFSGSRADSLSSFVVSLFNALLNGLYNTAQLGGGSIVQRRCIIVWASIYKGSISR